MKTVLNPSSYIFNPTLNQINFDNMIGAFAPERLFAVMNITTGKLIYSVGGSPNYNGTFSNGIYTNSVLTYVSSNAGQTSLDILECIYDDPSAIQVVSGTVASTITGTVSSNVAATDGTPLLTTTDPMTGYEGLNTHLQSSSYGGQIGQPIPIPNNNNALSVGFLNGGNLVSPKMDPTTNELIVQANFAAAATQNVNITEINSTALGGTALPIDITSQSGPNLETNINIGGITPDTGLGASTAATLRTASNVAFAGTAAQTGSGTINSGTQRVVLATDQPTVPTSTNLTTVNGTGITLGQKTMSLSLPVVVSSDQSPIDVEQPDLYITGAANSAIGNNNLLAVAGPSELDVSSYKSAAVQVISTATSGTFIFEGSNSTTSSTFQPIPAFRLDSASPNAIVSAITATNSNFIYIIPVRFRYMRMRVVTTLNTPVIALTRLSQDGFQSPVQQVINSTAANLNATVSGSLTGVTTVTTVSAVTSITNTVNTKVTAIKGQIVRNNYATTNVTTGAYVQLIASTTAAYTAVEVFDSSGQSLVLAIGAAAAEVDQFYIFPGGNGRVNVNIATAQRISVKAISGNATSGELLINFYA